MNKTISFALEDTQHINFEDYEDDEFAIGKLGFLSTRPNAHGLEISEEVLREYAPSVLGKWLVAKMNFNKSDATTHLPDEQIMGIIPKDQEVEFVEDDDGYLRAYADVVISKIYAKDFCNIFSNENDRAVSVEMKIQTKDGNDMNDIVESLRIVGVTVLGASVRPSCPESNIEFVRFAEEAESYFGKAHLTAEKQEVQMAEKIYKIDKSKDSMSDSAWGDVDKTALRNKIMEASNRSELVKSVYLLVEEDWEDAPSEHLKYPVMELKGDTFVYNRGGLASALGYAEKENETSVINKIKKIYKNLGIDDEGKEGESKMAEIEFAAVNIGDLWSSLWNALGKKYDGYNYTIEDIYEESNQKFVLIKKYGENILYRLDFSLTEDGLTLADEMVKVEIDIVETDEIRKFAEPENVEEYRTFAETKTEESTEEKVDEKEESEAKLEEVKEEKTEEMSEEKAEDDSETKTEMSAEELTAKVAQLEADITERDNIIMEKDAELTELRAYKESCMSIERATKVETVMSEVAKFMDETTAENFRSKGMDCAFSEIDAWANEVKASVVDKVTKSAKQANNDDFTRMSAIENNRPDVKSGSALERLKVKFCN